MNKNQEKLEEIKNAIKELELVKQSLETQINEKTPYERFFDSTTGIPNVYSFLCYIDEDHDDIPIDKWDITDEKNEVVLGNGFTLFTVLRHGGHEGSGEKYYVVWELRKNGTPIEYWRCDGYYASYDGTSIDLSNAYEVTPKEETIIVYKKK
jgi:hypothetical protein